GWREFDKRVYLPSSAISGLDGMRSAKDEIESDVLVTTKNPKALKGAKFFETSKIDLDTIEKATTIYEGSAQEAVTLFPANINVAAILSLAGIDDKKTSVKIIADHSTKKHI